MIFSRQLLVKINVASSSLILSNLVMDVIHTSAASVLTRATERHIPEDGILHSQSRENLKFCILLQFS
jgi:hypothetical protein